MVATTRAAARVGGCVGLLFAAPIVVIVLLVLTIGGCHALGKIT